MLLVGFTPGPNNPKNLDSFLWPLVEEMLRLHEGIKMVWNTALGEYFTLHAYITIVTADMPGREKLMHMKGRCIIHLPNSIYSRRQYNCSCLLDLLNNLSIGNRAYRYCNYCTCWGIWNAAVYCPFSSPLDGPGGVDCSQWKRYHRTVLPMRDNDRFRADARHIEETGHKEAADHTRISGLAILAQVPSIDFPRSFPPDSMHLFFENVIPALVRHYRGIFFKKDYGPEAQPAMAARDNGSAQRRRSGRSRGNSRPHPGVTEGHSTGAGFVGLGAASGAIRGTQKLKFETPSDPWNVAPKVWESIG